MEERQIPFSGAMVRAILDGRKTQTRRIVVPQPEVSAAGNLIGEWLSRPLGGLLLPKPQDIVIHCPYGQPGDRLWVREAWRVGKPHDITRPRDILPKLIERGQGVTVLYEAGGWLIVGPEGRDEPIYPDDEPMPDWAGKLRQSMFMPRAFSRITLEVTGVRVERLREISKDDAIAEGIEQIATTGCGNAVWKAYDKPDSGKGYLSPGYAYKTLWDSLNASRGYDWDANPWVWVVEFKRIEQ